MKDKTPQASNVPGRRRVPSVTSMFWQGHSLETKWLVPVPLSLALLVSMAPQHAVAAPTSSERQDKGAGGRLAAADRELLVPEVRTRLGSEPSSRSVLLQKESLPLTNPVRSDLGTVSESALLNQGRALAPRGGANSVSAERKSLRETRKVEQSLRFGAFRSESLADGAVSAPGMKDFATFFRASSSATRGGNGALVRLGEQNDAYMARQAEAEKLRVQTVASIKTILATNPPPEQKLNLLMRLAEIQVESHSYLLELEIKTFKKTYDEWQKTGRGPEPKFSDKSSKTRLLAGIESLRKAAREFPTHTRTPEILYNLGFLLNQVGSDSAKLYFEQLVTKFPTSDYVPRAYLALGEFYFQKNEFREALKNYQAVLKYKGTDSYNYAVYKIGWTYFNLPGKNTAEHQENLRKSLAAFQLIVKLADSPDAPPLLRSLRSEALRDMVLVFVDLKDISGAEKFYASLGESGIYQTFLERLAWQSTEAGEFDGSVAIYRKLLAEAPLHPRMPVFMARLVEVHEKRLDYASVLAAFKLMASTLAKDSPWWAANKNSSSVLAERDDVMRKAFNYWPKFLHAEAQKTKRPEYYNYALDAYLTHIQYEAQSRESYESYFYSGEIYVYLKRHEDAATQYTRAVTVDEKFKMGHKLTRDALLNAIASLDTAAASRPPLDLPPPGKAAAAIPFTSLQAKLVWCFDAFVRLFPSDPESTALAHRAARYDYAFGNYNAAQSRWMALAKRDPKSSEAAEGIRLILRVRLNQEDWQATRDAGAAFLALPELKEAYVARDIIGVMKFAQFQLALSHENAKRHEQAEQTFVSYQREYPDDNDAPKALFNAAGNAFKAGKMDAAVSYLQTLVSQYSKSELVPEALYQVASSMDTLGQFSESASHYEKIVQRYPSHKLAEAAALRSVQQREALAQYEAVDELGRAFLARWPGSVHAPMVWSSVGQSQVRRGQLEAGTDTFLAASKAYNGKQPQWAVYFFAQAALASEQAGKTSERNKYVALGLKTFDKLGAPQRDDAPAVEGVSLMARARLLDVEKDFSRVLTRKITDGLKLTDQFSVIRAEVEKVANQYVEIVKLGQAEAGIQALFRVAELQAFLATSLLSAPVPVGATAEESEKFRSELERIALPLQEEASSLLLTAWQRAKETEAMTPFTAEIYRKLVELRPSEYRKLDGRLPVPSYFGSRLMVSRGAGSLIGL